MKHTTLAIVLTSAAALLSAPETLAAQQLAIGGPARPVATYEFHFGPREAGFVRKVTVADSAGTLVARAELAPAGQVLPMQVEAVGDDLMLQGQLPDGVLTLVFDRQVAGPEGRDVNGHWYLGRREGQLRGRVQP